MMVLSAYSFINLYALTTMNKQEIATKILTQKQGIANTADFAVARLSNNLR